ncbi:hypothetical protein GCM10027058_00040 [Microbacterium neimengense]
MLNRVRSLWRAARRVPLVRHLLTGIDRLWWARTIGRAQVVDPEIVAAQLRRPVSSRAAIRHYVRGAHREGFTLNPLFMEATVSRQLSDADRVPALYAYLINDPTRIVTSPSWDATELVRRRPEALRDPGGPLGFAWRDARAGGSLPVRGGEISAQRLWAAVAASAIRTPAEPGLVTDRALIVCVVGAHEVSPDLALAAAAAAAQHLDADLDVVLLDDAYSTRLHARILAAGDPRIRVRRPQDGRCPSPARREGKGLTVYRGPGAEVTEPMLVDLASWAADGPVAPLWVSGAGVILSAGAVWRGGARYRLLEGHTVEDARRLGDAISVPALDAPLRAWPEGTSGEGAGRTLTDLVVMTPGPCDPLPLDTRATAVDAPRTPDSDVDAIVAAAGLRVKAGSDVPVLERVPGTPRRWAIKTAAPAGLAGESWGETHFARALAASLERLGEQAIVDARAAVDRPTASLDDVVLVLRGPHRLVPPRAGLRMLWIISHPDEITAAELDDFDVVFAASEDWAARASARFRRTIRPLLQCTDATRFRPTGAPSTGEIVFVGTARGIARPVVVEPLRAGIPVRVYGPDWRGYIPASAIAARGIPNDELPLRYETASVVLNDHWPAMRREGFISNRLFDVVAAGGRAISDHVVGIDRIFDGAVQTFRSADELIAMLQGDLDARFPDSEALARTSEHIRRSHSFDARARVLVLTADGS